MAIASGAQKGARIAAGIDSKSHKNRFRIVPESTPNRPKSTQNRSRDPPGTPRAPKGGPRASQGRPLGGPGGPRRDPGGVSGDAPWAPRDPSGAPRAPLGFTSRPRSAKNARRESDPWRGSLRKRSQSDFRAIFERFSVDLRVDFRVRPTLRVKSLRKGSTLSSHGFFPYETQVGLCARTAKNDQKSSCKRLPSEPFAESHSRAENI